MYSLRETGIPGTVNNPQNGSINSLTPGALHDVMIPITKNHQTVTKYFLLVEVICNIKFIFDMLFLRIVRVASSTNL